MMLISPDARLLSYQGVRPVVGRDVFLAPGAIVIGDVILGEKSSIWFHAVVRGDVYFIRIGRESNLQDNSVVHVTAETHPVQIGDQVTIGHAAIIHGATLEDGCLIGMGARILDGARVGEGALVAAGSVVPPGMRIPPGMLAIGTPARIKRPLDDEEKERVRRSSELYVEYAVQHARELGLLPGA